MKRPMLVLGIGLAVSFCAAAIAYATIPGPDGVIHACLTKVGREPPRHRRRHRFLQLEGTIRELERAGAVRPAGTDGPARTGR